MTPDPRAVEIIREALEDSSSQDDEGAMWLTDREYPDAAARIARWLADAGWSLLPPERTRIEWASCIREPGVQDWYIDWPTEAAARQDVADRCADGQDAILARRTATSAYTTPWLPSDTPGEPA